MGLTFASPPSDGNAALMKGLQDLSTASMLGAGTTVTGVMEPHPVYELGLLDLNDGKGLKAALQTTWRYLLVAGQNIVQAAEISSSAGGNSSKFNSLTSGYASAMEGVFQKAEQLPEVSSGNYEIRLLRVPALYVTALWLKDLRGIDDRFLCVEPVFPPFNSSAVYDCGDISQMLQVAATKKLAEEGKLQIP